MHESFSALQSSLSTFESQNGSAAVTGFIKASSLKFVDDVIGKGGFGVVRKATFQGEIVAVKSLKLDEALTMDPLKAIKLFASEAVKMRSVRHPCIVEFKGFALEIFAIVMQFMPDGTLYEYIKQSGKSIPWSEKFWCAADVAEGMAFLHSSKVGLFHQDLKTLNVLLKREDRLKAKISDFGLSGEH
jgi:serine/threonine protein kinase